MSAILTLIFLVTLIISARKFLILAKRVKSADAKWADSKLPLGFWAFILFVSLIGVIA